jgi:hypothetical protein
MQNSSLEPIKSEQELSSEAGASTSGTIDILVVKGAYVFTMIEDIKQYVRRKSINAKGRARVTMTTTNIGKALDFGSEKNAKAFKDRMGNGYSVELVY